MTSSARAGRRRRLLHEGAANSSVQEGGAEESAGSNARFTPPTESASFAVAGSVAPRSPLALLGVVAGLAVVTGALTFADQLGLSLEGGGNVAAAGLLTVDQPGSLAAWWQAGLWLAVTGQCVLLFGLRRHRTDDMSSAYRWWLIAAVAAVGMSINSATHAHQILAGQLASLTGFSPLANGAFWWLAPGGVLLGAVGLRSLLEVKESPLALAFSGAVVVASILAAVAGSSSAPSALTAGVAPSLVSSTAAMAMAGCVLMTLLAYSRRIVRESLGEVERPASKPVAAIEPAIEEATPVTAEPETQAVEAVVTKAVSRPRRASATAAVIADEVDEEEALSRRRQSASRSKPKRPTLAQETTTEWVSGPEGDEDYDDDTQHRKLSKAERKRLRREKARHAA